MITLLKYFKNNKINRYIFVICVYTIKAIRFIEKEAVKMIELNVKKYGIYWFNFGDINNSEKGVQFGIRPAIIVSNAKCNKYSPTVTAIPISSKVNKMTSVPTHVFIKSGDENNLKKDSIVLCEQVITISKERILEDGYIGEIKSEIIRLKIRKALDIQLGNLPIIEGVNKSVFLTRMNNEIREYIIKIIKQIRSLEILISDTDNELFIKLALQERESKLNKLEYVCNKNGFNYCEFYERYTA